MKELRLAWMEQKKDIAYVAAHGSELSDMNMASLVKPEPDPTQRLNRRAYRADYARIRS